MTWTAIWGWCPAQTMEGSWVLHVCLGPIRIGGYRWVEGAGRMGKCRWLLLLQSCLLCQGGVTGTLFAFSFPHAGFAFICLHLPLDPGLTLPFAVHAILPESFGKRVAFDFHLGDLWILVGCDSQKLRLRKSEGSAASSCASAPSSSDHMYSWLVAVHRVNNQMSMRIQGVVGELEPMERYGLAHPVGP